MENEVSVIGHLPWGEGISVWDLYNRVTAIDPKTCYSPGSGLFHTPLIKQLRDYPFDFLYLSDIYPLYVRKLESERTTFKASQLSINQGDATTEHCTFKDKRFDLVLLFDIIEHVFDPDDKSPERSKQVGLKFLADMERVGKNVLGWVPEDYCPISEDPWHTNNQLGHTHFSTWFAEDFINLGYSVERFKGFHNHAVARYYTADRKWDCSALYVYKKTI